MSKPATLCGLVALALVVSLGGRVAEAKDKGRGRTKVTEASRKSGGRTKIAEASPRGRVRSKIAAAMESYDQLEYDAAKKLLGRALALVKKYRLGKDPIAAKAHLSLGIVQFGNHDQDKAKLSFLSAVQIDPEIQIEPAYRSAELAKLLDQVRDVASLGNEDKPGKSGKDKADKAEKADKPEPAPSSDAEVAQPAKSEPPPVIAPAVVAEATESDPPLDESTDEGVAEESGERTKRDHVMIAVSGGTGVGYVGGQTEAMNPVTSCCLGSSLLVLQAELGFFATRGLAIGVAGRVGLPIGATVPGHADKALGGLLRLRYAFGDDGDGVRLMFQGGAGILRHTIQIESGMDVDVVAQGPLLLGGGLGFVKRLNGTVSVIADASVLAAIAVVDSMDDAPVLNSGFGVDLSLGLQLGF